MSDHSLILLSGWDPPVVAQFALERQAELRAALRLYNKPVESQEQADEVAALIGECERWESDIEAASEETRNPYFKHAKLIKATTDACQRVIIDARRPIQNHLANFEAEKLRVKQQLERQAAAEAERQRREEEEKIRQAELERQRQEREERERLADIERERLRVAAEERAKIEEKERQARDLASKSARAAAEKEAARMRELEAIRQREEVERVKAERERQATAQAERLRQQEEEQARLAAIAPAPVTWEAPKTEGVSAGTELEFEVVNEREFAEWCWANGRSHWVRKIEFEKRPITEELAKVPDTSPVPQVPGLAVRRVAAVRVKKAKAQRTLNVATTRVGL
jgi:hypothetical protein